MRKAIGIGSDRGIVGGCGGERVRWEGRCRQVGERKGEVISRESDTLHLERKTERNSKGSGKFPGNRLKGEMEKQNIMNFE